MPEQIFHCPYSEIIILVDDGRAHRKCAWHIYTDTHTHIYKCTCPFECVFVWFCMYAALVLLYQNNNSKKKKKIIMSRVIKGFLLLLKGHKHSRNDDVIVSYHSYQECNDDTVQTMPKPKPICLCWSNGISVEQRRTEKRKRKKERMKSYNVNVRNRDGKIFSFCFIIHPFSNISTNI